MSSYVLGFKDIDKTKLAIVGGKGANLGELSRIEGIQVPEGFCITTEAYKSIIGQSAELKVLMDQLSSVKVEDREKITEISGEIRKVIEGITIPKDIAEEIDCHLEKLGKKNAYAVRSSATAEDLPTASFAGQQDTYLNIKGKDSILKHVSRCWASLFTDRAVTYRIQNGFDHSKVYLSVVIQRMVFPQAAGIMFTADPITSNRKVVSIDASFGLGEALVSGLVNADIYKVRDGSIVDKKISTKKLAVYALEKGGTEEREIEHEQQNNQTLTDQQILQLEKMGRKIEDYFGRPQDIEWCLYENAFFIVQSRPITTLYPVPDEDDGENHVYISFGHHQVMTEAIKPLGMSFVRFLSDTIPLKKAGGRLFYDVTHDFASATGRKIVMTSFGQVDPLMKKAMFNLAKRKEFINTLPHGKKAIGTEGMSIQLLSQALRFYRGKDAAVIKEIISKNEASVRNLQKRIAKISGDELFDVILQDRKQLKEIMADPKSVGATLVGIMAENWINKKMEKWLGEKGAVDVLSQSVDNNITSEMGLELLDVADVVRQYPAVVEYFTHARDESFFADLARLEGGDAVIISIREYLEKYGMRCSGEVDITRPRWSEQPTALIPMILSNINNFGPNAHMIKLEQGLLGAKQKEQELLKRLEQLPGGKGKAKKTKKMIKVMRNLIGYREYPKYGFIKRYAVYKTALLKEAGKLVQNKVIREKEDIFYLSLEELREVVMTNRIDYSIIEKRKADYEVYEKLTPPRVMTSEGEIITSEYDTGSIPKGALAGVPVSSGVIEGRARVILKLEDAKIEDGDILVTVFTDPSWTPLFVSIKGLVAEVGGMMSHGAVITREYGLPAVVGVENATKLIKDGQRIRINGTEGYVEIL